MSETRSILYRGTRDELNEMCRIKDERIAALEIAVRRGIAEIKTLLPIAMWDGFEGEEDEARVYATLELMERALGDTFPPTERRKE